jgi:hypothetical protein
MHVSSRGAIRATIAAACVLGLSASLPQAQAADFNQPAINATLAFSPTNLGDGQYTNLCALNMNKAPVTVNFVIQTPGLAPRPCKQRSNPVSWPAARNSPSSAMPTRSSPTCSSAQVSSCWRRTIAARPANIPANAG